MKIIADICVIPLNTAKASVREEVASFIKSFGHGLFL